MGKVRFGTAYNAGFPDDGSKGPTYIKNIHNFIETLDEAYESVWVADHFTLGCYTAMDNDILECLTTISYLSARYPNRDFGSLVLASSFRNPALLAKMSATLNLLSEGRFILGIGAGWNEEEYRQYGYEFLSNRTRIKQMEEAIQIIKLLWTQDDVTFKGKYYGVENAYCHPKPDPAPPIMIGGSGEKYTLRAVARYADWWNTVGYDSEAITHKLRVLEQHCDNVGRDFDDILKTELHFVALADSDEEAHRTAKRAREHSSLYQLNRIIGSPDTVTAQLGEYIDAGISYFQLIFLPPPNKDAVQLFAEEVIPELT